MFSVTKILHFSYAHRLLNYEGKCKHLHGHNGKIEVILALNKLDERGMVQDFEEIKKTIGQWIQKEMDHKTLLSAQDPLTELLKKTGEPIFLMDATPTAENIAKLIFDYAKTQHMPVVEVRLWETPDSSASYREDKP